MSRGRHWTPRANTVVRPRTTGTAPTPERTWQRPGTLDVDTWPTPGAALARRTVVEFPASVPGELAVLREWLARWESVPPEQRNPAYEAMRDYLAGLEEAVAPIGEFAWWNYFCNH
jgi:hypothetical protein